MMKYLILEKKGATVPLVVIFLGATTHEAMAAFFQPAGWQPVAAGFTAPIAGTPGFYCWGRSALLCLSARAQDADIIRSAAYTTSKTDPT